MTTQTHPTELTQETFDRFIELAGVPVVIDFWAPWCGPCRAMAPQFEEAARQMEGKAIFAKVNTDDAPMIAARYGVRSIPTLLVLNKCEEVARESGTRPASDLIAWVEAASA